MPALLASCRLKQHAAQPALRHVVGVLRLRTSARVANAAETTELDKHSSLHKMIILTSRPRCRFAVRTQAALMLTSEGQTCLCQSQKLMQSHQLNTEQAGAQLALPDIKQDTFDRALIFYSTARPKDVGAVRGAALTDASAAVTG
eukprot:5348920-Pleurochrysis_carterae.AAC.3